MNISEKEQRILAAIENHATLPIGSISKQLGYRDHTIRYVIHSFEQRGMITPITVLNFYALGYEEHVIFCSFSPEFQNRKQEVLDTMIQMAPVTWIGELGGEYQYAIAIAVRSIVEVSDFLYKLSSHFGSNVIASKAISSRIDFYHFGRKYLDPKRKKQNQLLFGFEKQHSVSISIDELDYKILRLLGAEGIHSQHAIAKSLNISVPTIHNRIKRLEKHNIIRAYAYHLNQSKIGMHMYELLVYTRGINAELRDQLHSFAQTNPHVLYYLHTIGEWDFELGIEVQKAEDVVAITEALYAACGADVLTIKVIPLFRYVHLSYFPFTYSAIQNK